MRILIVEDEALIRMLICDLLEEEGHECQSAVDGEQALTLLDKGRFRPDILVTDYNLGAGLNGMTLAREIQNRMPGLPTVFATGNPDCFADYRFQTWEALVAKPFCGQDLVAAVEGVWTATSFVEDVIAGANSNTGISLFLAVTGRHASKNTGSELV